MADKLNAAGLTTGKGKPFTTGGVARIRDAYKIWGPRTVAVQDGEVSVNTPPPSSASPPTSSTTGDDRAELRRRLLPRRPRSLSDAWGTLLTTGYAILFGVACSLTGPPVVRWGRRLWGRGRPGLAVAWPVGATVLVATPANAAKPHSVPLTTAGVDQAGPLSISFSTTLTKAAGVVLTRNQAADVIYCGGTLTTPFQSGAAIRVSVVAFCTDIVDKIEIGVAIARDNQLVAERFLTPPATNTDLADHFAVFGCPGTTSNYTGAGAARFTKAGYVGSPLTMQAVSATVSITC